MKPEETNPFTAIGIGKRIYITKEEEVRSVDQSTGELFYMKKLPASKEVPHDSLTYTKVFIGDNSFIYSMSINGLKLFNYCIYNLVPNRDIIVLHSRTCMEKCNMGRTSFFKAIKELTKNGVIWFREGSTCEYWINTNLFFNGNRLRIYK